ncbi:hypothetical protein [Methylophilus sp. TWE2]|uniref:hypothetical protein n=1 Tax=Methylophilus sp. TWE2 TaxID=1662285 RepID=UPI00067131CE|nr:hypothetical protein [Methylophilus sp. TWE2]AKR43662.1 hypothetical protein ACJ67_09655 [Methylophilus sp. TWE2]
MKSVFKNMFACSVLILATMTAHATIDHLAFERVVAHADLTITPDRMASSEDEQADSSDADTMLA